MKIGFTGTQSGMTEWQKNSLRETLEYLKGTEFVHDDSPGASQEANEIAFDYGIRIFTIFPPLNGKKRAWCFNPSHSRMDSQWHAIEHKGIQVQVRWMPMDDYLKRNKHIVDNVDHMISAPKEHQHSLKSGTWSTIRYIWKIKKSHINIPPVDRSEE